METQLQRLLQIGVLVENVESAVRRFEEDFGFGPWNIVHFGPEMFPNLIVDGKPGKLEQKLAFCKAFGMEIELVEPISEGPYLEWIREHGPGIHHLAVITRDPFAQVVAEHERMTGKKPWIWCRDGDAAPGEGMEFAYLDLRKEIGLILEIYNEQRSGGIPFRKEEERT